MNAIVKSVLPGSYAYKTIISPGDALRKVNGKPVGDVLDYKYLTYDACLLLELNGADGNIKLVRIRKPEGSDIGLEFETFLMDRERSCVNKCIFCFIDQLPKGMRETLYYKDDDVRLSFLQGNYVTLTNLSRHDVDRIIGMRVSPLNVSVHTLDPDLRAFMIGAKNGATGAAVLKELAGAGIMLNCQIVCCPGVNDGRELIRTIEGLIELGPCVNSVSVVPVGLTKHRQGLTKLSPFDRKLAIDTVKLVGGYGEKCLKKRRTRVFFCADELYMKAGLELPPHIFYEDYPQLENGVGMMRLFITEFEKELGQVTNLNLEVIPRRAGSTRSAGVVCQNLGFSVATGVAAFKYLTNLLKSATEKDDRIKGKVYAIRNVFFGESVNVSGLVTGRDLIAQLKGCNLGSRLLIPQNMLRHKEDVFLDDITVSEVSDALGVSVRVVKQDGADLLHAFIEN